LAYTGQALAFCLVPFFFGTLRMTLREHPYILMIDVLFTLMGGGVPVLLSTFYAIASDVSGEKDK
jgi:MFS transporter, PCFT/HCP family, solute carrier family 46 (folate transporter), member 1